MKDTADQSENKATKDTILETSPGPHMLSLFVSGSTRKQEPIVSLP